LTLALLLRRRGARDGIAGWTRSLPGAVASIKRQKEKVMAKKAKKVEKKVAKKAK
jgi:hypothetical protein